MPVTIPATNTSLATNTKELRYSVRSDGNSGFVFMHNYQDHAANNDLTGLQLAITTKNGTIKIPEQGNFTLQKDKHAMLPFNMKAGNALIRYATTQPLASFAQDGINYHVFVSIDGMLPEFYLQTKSGITADKNCTVKKKNNGAIIKGNNNTIFSFSIGTGKNKNSFLVIPMAMAVNAYALKSGLVFTKESLLINENSFDLLTRNSTGDSLLFYPALKATPTITGASLSQVTGPGNQFSAYKISFAPKTPAVKFQHPMPANYVANFEGNVLDGLNDVFLKIDYVGDNAQVMLDGQLVADHFYYGAPWEIGIKRFANQLKDQPLYLFFHAIRKDAACLAYFKDRMPPFGDKDEYLEIRSVTIVPEYKCRINIE
jgi:hypothetical protein